MSNFTCPKGSIVDIPAAMLLAAANADTNDDNLWYLGAIFSISTTVISAFGTYFIRRAFVAMREEGGRGEADSEYQVLPDEQRAPNNPNNPNNHNSKHLPHSCDHYLSVEDCPASHGFSRHHSTSGQRDRLNSSNLLVPATLEMELKVSGGRRFMRILLLIGNLCIGVLAPAIDVAALSFAAQSIVIPMSGLTIIWNFFVAVFFLHESYDRYDVVGALFTLAGTVVVAVSGSHSSFTYPLPVLLCLFRNRPFIYYAIGFASLMVLLACGSRSQSKRVSMMSASMLPGLVGGNHYFIKALSELLRLAVFSGTTFFGMWQSYIISLAGILLAVLQLILLNVALSKYDALAVIPMYLSTLICVGSISGMCFFVEYAGLQRWQFITYGVGMFLVVVGILLSSRRGLVVAEEEDDEISGKSSVNVVRSAHSANSDKLF